MYDGLQSIDGITVYGDTENIEDKVGVVTFNLNGMKDSELAQRLADQGGIAERQGAFCSHPYVFRLLGIPDEVITEEMYEDDFSMPGMVRVSFGIYNTEEEVDQFLEILKVIADKAKNRKRSRIICLYKEGILHYMNSGKLQYVKCCSFLNCFT